MPHQLDFITHDHLLKAIQYIDQHGVPKNNEWNEYWINYRSKLYPFKYTVKVASEYTNTPLEKTTDFTSSESSRNTIASLGFHILFRTPSGKTSDIRYWVGASYYGHPGNQIDMFKDFLQDNYWRTDHDLDQNEGFKIYNLLQDVQVNDRICIRYFDKKGGNIHIAAMGTVANVSEINNGRLRVNWDYNPPEFKGTKPSGAGSGNWWKTLFELKQPVDIQRIFSETFIEQRAARLTWNFHGWVMPSGSFGKSEDRKSHEARYGYGHEEWLFDTGKLIDGYHYGFLEPIRKAQQAFEHQTYDVWLYSINGNTKKRHWIGWIRNLIVIDSQEANRVRELYHAHGWLTEMKEQIIACEANPKGFSNWKGIDLFNVKFKPTDLQENDHYTELPNDHPINGLSRYNFAHFKKEFEAGTVEHEDTFAYIPGKESEGDDEQPRRKKHIRQPMAVEIVYLHKAISHALTKTLQAQYKTENVTQEHPAGYGANKIDIVVNDENKLIFYEIKTYNAIRTSIREALGQLLEYCYYPDKRKAVELIIVSHVPADQNTKAYFEHLRTMLSLNIWYQSYDLKSKTLSKKN